MSMVVTTPITHSAKPPKAVIFDWDNTLVDTWPLIQHALENTFVKFNLAPWSLEETKANVGHSLRDSFPTLFGEHWEAAGKAYQTYYLDNHLTDLHVLPQAEEVLKFLHEKGVYLAVVSNKRGPTLRKEVEHIGWNHYFQKLIGSDDAERDKPHADPVHMALEGSGIEPGEDVWFIGDTGVDLECAQNTMCFPILYGHTDEVEAHPELEGKWRLKGFDANHHVRNHEELLELLRKTW